MPPGRAVRDLGCVLSRTARTSAARVRSPTPEPGYRSASRLWRFGLAVSGGSGDGERDFQLLGPRVPTGWLVRSDPAVIDDRRHHTDGLIGESRPGDPHVDHDVAVGTHRVHGAPPFV